MLPLLAVGGLVLVAARPSTTRVERSITIAAPAAIPFGLVNDFHRWKYWAPWEALAPEVKRGFDGAYAGTEAVYTWAGNARTGKGRMTILYAQPYEHIRIQAERYAPQPSSSTYLFTYQSGTEGVTLRWARERHLSLLDKARALFMDPDEGVGEEIEQGLKSLQSLSEAEVRNRLERDALIKARQEGATTPPTPPAP
ncbi:SRPBCC family protein [Melittangium boletus]|uniref:SRPBCC family protein n=1 Tax=Melittangium boletus TaxID=83453 RepID=UPI00147410D3|nr:SRPBCC family protein [Melittangium boletus]